MRLCRSLMLMILFCGTRLVAQAPSDTITVPSGNLQLRAVVWRPVETQLLPTVLFTHGSGCGDGQPVEEVAQQFVKHGFLFVYLYRRGHGLSASQGMCAADLMNRERAERGDEARARLQYELMTGDHFNDLQAGLRRLRTIPGVDTTRLVVGGHSFGAQLAILAAEQDVTLKAALDFAGAAQSWSGSPELRERLLSAAARSPVPMFVAHAENDFSVEPGRALSDAMARASRPHRFVTYPAVGASPSDGHMFVYLAPRQWEPDVFAFLAQYVRE